MKPGDVVLVKFPGAVATKVRPALVISSMQYHQTRHDVIIGILTSKTDKANTPSDYVLENWQQAGLDMPTAYRAYIITVQMSDLRKIGQLTQDDWNGVVASVKNAVHLSAI